MTGPPADRPVDPVPPLRHHAPPPAWQLGLAFTVIYLVWGATFLATHFAVAEVRPLHLVSIRCVGGGALMLAWWRATRAPSPADWTGAWIAGVLFFVTGQGLLMYAMQFVPSGTAAVVLATIPLWLVAIEAVLERSLPSGLVIGGSLVGFGGVLMLTLSRAPGGLSALPGAAVAALLGSSFSWAAGSHYSRRRRTAEDPLARTGRQLLAGGLTALAMAVALGGPFLPGGGLTLRAGIAVLFLILGGTVAGFGAYSWLLGVVSPAAVGTYGFVNPVVALFLGWLFAGEALTTSLMATAAVILAGVAMVGLAPARRPG